MTGMSGDTEPARELTLERVRLLDPTTNAFVAVHGEQALEAAQPWAQHGPALV